ncbi:MAG: ABC transporter permease [Eggerthellaceae bacterium]|nr:ABC transporter permease [Eggerthellaceae bacterium]
MNIFKAACRVLLNHKSYILIYVVFLGAMGVFVAAGNSHGAVEGTTFEQVRASVAVVDRDGGEVTRGLREALSDEVELVDVADDERALQDAAAQNRANCLVIVPAGYTDAFVEAALAGAEPPQLETVVSFDDTAGFEAENHVRGYLSCVAARLAVAGADASASALVDGVDLLAITQAAHEDMAHASAATYVVEEDEALPLPDDYLLYNRWTVYPITCAVGVLVAVTMAGFNRLDVRRRNLSAPVSSLSLSLSLAAAGVLCMLVTWAWMAVQGVAAFGGSLSGVEGWRIALCVVDMLAYSLFALAFGFLVAQCGAREVMANGVANIMGLVLSFLGGAWIDVSLMGPTMEAVGRFTPTYWHGQALTAIAHADAFTWDALAPAAGDMGIVLLFAAALFAVALLVGRVRMQNGIALSAPAQAAQG